MVCQLCFRSSLSASRALMSSCFFACSASDDTGGQDGLRRDGRPSSAACSINLRRSATTNDACSSTPRTHQGTCSPPRRRIPCFYLIACKDSELHSQCRLVGRPSEVAS